MGIPPVHLYYDSRLQMREPALHTNQHDGTHSMQFGHATGEEAMPSGGAAQTAQNEGVSWEAVWCVTITARTRDASICVGGGAERQVGRARIVVFRVTGVSEFHGMDNPARLNRWGLHLWL